MKGIKESLCGAISRLLFLSPIRDKLLWRFKMLIETKVKVSLPFEPVEIIPTVYWNPDDPFDQAINNLFLKLLWPLIEQRCKEIADDVIWFCNKVSEAAKEIKETGGKNTCESR
jgi:hypothetical protein